MERLGKKIVSVKFTAEGELFVNSNDSRVRLFDENFELLQKYKGHTNNKYPLRTDFFE